VGCCHDCADVTPLEQRTSRGLAGRRVPARQIVDYSQDLDVAEPVAQPAQRGELLKIPRSGRSCHASHIVIDGSSPALTSAAILR
jgi:hypothetical protein